MSLNIITDPSTDITFCDSVRRLLGGVDADALTDEDILDPTFFDMAEMEILSMVPCLELDDVSSKDKSKGRLAMIHLIAAKLCHTMKNRVEYEVKTIDVTWRKSPVKYDDLHEQLMGSVDTLINSISCVESADGDSSLFRVAPSKRAVRSE